MAHSVCMLPQFSGRNIGYISLYSVCPDSEATGLHLQPPAPLCLRHISALSDLHNTFKKKSKQISICLLWFLLPTKPGNGTEHVFFSRCVGVRLHWTRVESMCA